MMHYLKKLQRDPRDTNQEVHDPERSARPSNWLEQPVRSGYERAAFVIFLFFVVAVRIPKAWVEGRFWAEEGTVFFSKAWNLSWWEALLAPHANYLNLAANIAALLAARLSTLETAPYVTTTIATGIQCLPAVLLLLSRDDWLQRRGVVLAAFLVLVFVPVPEEVWSNSANSYHHLALCAALILALETRDGVVGTIHGCLLLLLAALSGPASWSLIPLYALRAAFDRSGQRALQGLILSAGAVVQLMFFSSLGQRDFGAIPSLFGAIVLAKHVLLPMLGHTLAVGSIGELASKFQDGHGPLWPLILVFILFSTAITIAAKRPKQPALWFLLASAVLAGAGYLGSIDRKIDLVSTSGSGRHVFAPQVLIGLALLNYTIWSRGRFKALSGIILAWIVLVGIYNCFAPVSEIYMTGPNWLQEVAHWRSDPSHPLQIWPMPWSMKLSVK